MSRGSLQWWLTLTEDGHLPYGGVMPFLIQWDEAIHPAARMMDSGRSLLSLRGSHLQAPDILAALQNLDATQLISLEKTPPDCAPRLLAFIQTPDGVKKLS